QARKDGTQLPQLVAGLNSQAANAREKIALDALAIALAKSQEQGLKAVLERLRKGQFIEADAASQTQYRPQMDAVSKALDDVIRLEVDLADAEYRSAVTLVREQAFATIAVTLIALVLCLAITGLIARSLRGMLGAGEGELVAAAKEVAE